MVKYLAGTLGLVALFVAIVIGTLAAIGIFSFAPVSFQTFQSQPNPPDLEHLSPQKAQLKDKTFTVGDVRWTMTSVRHVDKLTAFAYPHKSIQGDFVVVSFKAKNISKSPVTLSSDLMELSKSGRTITPHPVSNTEFVNPEKDLLFSDVGLLSPGESKPGEIIFDLNPYSPRSHRTLKGFELHVKDPNPTTLDKEKSLELKF